MKISKILMMCATSLLISSQSYAEVSAKPQFGIGVAIDSDVQKIYAPVTVGSFIIEPTIAVEYSDDEETNQTDNSKEKSEDKFLELGIGAFHFIEPNDKTRLYYGARVGYVRLENETDSFSSDSDGYYIAPTAGFEYFFVPSVSLGGEVAWQYTDLEGDNDGDTDTDSKSNRTVTDIVLRYHF